MATLRLNGKTAILLSIMTIIPAIDLLDGACVRLYQGKYDASTIYERDPLATAQRFEAAGATRIHIVDLDAARGSRSGNRRIIARIRRAVNAVIEVGGGIRSDEDARELIELGVDRLVVGTVLVRDPQRLTRWAQKFPGKIIAGIDARDGEVRISGWEEDTAMTELRAAEIAAEVGAVSIIYTDIGRDGTMNGPNIAGCRSIAEHSDLPVIVSGGVRGAEDFELLSAEDPLRLPGIITGKALYEQRFDLEQALHRFTTTYATQPEVW
jgi:phosphoribosylformimino-5-aminoimidazole carboxamide ribotide isomerase